jgi:hypothetical protein
MFDAAAAQNLCPNAGFETYTSLPTTYAQTCFSSGWTSASGTCSLVPGTGSPDYYNTSGSGGAKPPATWWATVSPHTGGGIMGFVTWYSSGNYREYIERPLSMALTPGEQYTVSFWLSNGVSTMHTHGTNNIGVYFSLNSVAQSLGSPILASPQVEITSVVYTTTWKQFMLTFTPSQAFRYMTIGNFHNDAGTAMANFGSGTSGAYYFIDDIVVQPTLLLPVELIEFSGVRKNGRNLLHWKTALEENSDYFTVERSLDAVHFEEVGQVRAQGNSYTLQNYEFTDAHAVRGIDYYRLKQTDFDGSYRYSKIIQLKEEENALCIYPNPAGDKLWIRHSASAKVAVEIHSVTGASILHRVLEEQDALIDVSDLSRGVYFIKAMDGERVYADKFVLK